MHGEDADVRKSIRRAHDLREEHEDADFSLLLVSNRNTEVDDDLITDAQTMAEDGGVELEPVWDQSRLADFLDIEREGQHLRKVHLGIESERLTPERLKEISVEAIEGFGSYFNCDVRSTVDRSVTGSLRRKVKQNRNVAFIEGRSGFGKSTVAHEVARREVAEDGFALWIRPTVSRLSRKPQELVGKHLGEKCPGLEDRLGEAVEDITSERNASLVVLVDDVNRVPNSRQWLKTLTGWGEPESEESLRAAIS